MLAKALGGDFSVLGEADAMLSYGVVCGTKPRTSPATGCLACIELFARPFRLQSVKPQKGIGTCILFFSSLTFYAADCTGQPFWTPETSHCLLTLMSSSSLSVCLMVLLCLQKAQSPNPPEMLLLASVPGMLPHRQKLARQHIPVFFVCMDRWQPWL